MMDFIIRWVVPILAGLCMFWIIGRLTGKAEYGAKDDERSAFIKQKAIVGSWLFILMIFIVNIVFDFFNLRTGPLKNAPFDHPELFYFILLVGSYFVYYFFYSKRLSSHEK